MDEIHDEHIPPHREQINVEESVNATLACDDAHLIAISVNS